MFYFQKRAETFENQRLRGLESSSQHKDKCSPYVKFTHAWTNCRILRPCLKALGDPPVPTPPFAAIAAQDSIASHLELFAVLSILSGISGCVGEGTRAKADRQQNNGGLAAAELEPRRRWALAPQTRRPRRNPSAWQQTLCCPPMRQ